MSDGYVGIPIEVHKKESVELGRRVERAAIVAWLREEAEIYVMGSDCYPEDTTEHWIARRIEHSEHLRGDGV